MRWRHSTRRCRIWWPRHLPFPPSPNNPMPRAPRRWRPGPFPPWRIWRAISWVLPGATRGRRLPPPCWPRRTRPVGSRPIPRRRLAPISWRGMAGSNLRGQRAMCGPTPSGLMWPIGERALITTGTPMKRKSCNSSPQARAVQVTGTGRRGPWSRRHAPACRPRAPRNDHDRHAHPDAGPVARAGVAGRASADGGGLTQPSGVLAASDRWVSLSGVRARLLAGQGGAKCGGEFP